MNLLLVSDAWHPQVNGVVRTIDRTNELLAQTHGVTTTVISPEMFRSVRIPSEPGLKLSLAGWRAFTKRLDDTPIDHLHIATEGPLGWAARRYALRNGLGYTTAFHTQFAEYMAERYRLPVGATYKLLKRFHGTADQTLVTTPSMKERLAARGFKNLSLWSRGVDTTRFTADGPLPGESVESAGIKETISSSDWSAWPRPFWINVGRVAPEKNLDAFLSLDLPGTKIIVGDGPARANLMKRYPEAKFIGVRTGAALASWYRVADVFVFPSRTDTFGLVNVEALACGTPVAAYPVEGPRDIIIDGVSGFLDEDLRRAALSALELKASDAIATARRFSWQAATEQFYDIMKRYPSDKTQT